MIDILPAGAHPLQANGPLPLRIASDHGLRGLFRDQLVPRGLRSTIPGLGKIRDRGACQAIAGVGQRGCGQAGHAMRKFPNASEYG